ncbi:hypothetical protein SODALDRAFT_319390 [Sodiomyces alkalinus F11]|uniref:Uncharacterized protein n=1 Tax=Sodiomyces alkalinus (strain CBS 110278 / VKM F-3762 / F11) TaxID=1314773 RepID=A0A3N2Q7X6_SODAK|nr:hypothetical protein SODALDRAFT_319390 [Sodiomyces alkalinus F11]ROT42787.1 hypothetical protein SODALDRAFT_319390 [Sodiomyces alkalinus F11]
MANSNKPTDPLDQIQFMLNDVIVQIGKALRATNRQGDRRNLAQVQASVKSRVPDTIENFHWALDDLESEIVNAKAALQRDLDRLRAKRMSPRDEHSPAEAGSKSSVTMRTNFSQPTPSLQLKQENRDASGAAQAAPPAPMAPFPDMGVGTTPSPARVTDAGIKQEPAPSAPQAIMGPIGDAGASSAGAKIALAAPEAPMDDLPGMSRTTNGSGGGSGAEFNFTDMTFDLAPSSNEPPNSSTSQNLNMDTPRFGTADDMLSLDQFLAPNTGTASQPATSRNNAGNNATVAAAASAAQKPQELTKSTARAAAAGTGVGVGVGEGDKSNLDSTAMDLDIDVGGGADGSNFDDMFFGNSNVEDEIQFDDAFFGISST